LSTSIETISKTLSSEVAAVDVSGVGVTAIGVTDVGVIAVPLSIYQYSPVFGISHCCTV
jgi:hypothetical protein